MKIFIYNIIIFVFSEPLETKDALKNLTSLGKPFEISFSDMMSLMGQCHELHTPGLELRPEARLVGRGARGTPRGLIGNAVANPSAIFNGIVPGKFVKHLPTSFNIIKSF